MPSAATIPLSGGTGAGAGMSRVERLIAACGGIDGGGTSLSNPGPDMCSARLVASIVVGGPPVVARRTLGHRPTAFMAPSPAADATKPYSMETLASARDLRDAVKIRSREPSKSLEQVRYEEIERIEEANGQRRPKPRPPPTPHPTPCFHGTDYSFDCPQGWTHSLKMKGRKGNCLAPKTYIPPAGCLNQVSIDAKLRSPKEKHAYELQCRVIWPCVNPARERLAVDDTTEGPDGTGSKRFAVLRPDYGLPCPEDWVYFTDGSCHAPNSYGGSCRRKMHFLGYTRSMKAMWARMCEAGWPLVKGKPPLTEEEKEMAERRRMQSSALWAGRCPRDYHSSCPEFWHLDEKGWCHAPKGVAAEKTIGPVEFVPGNTNLCPATLSTHGLSTDMKKAFEKSCGVRWPCQGQAAVESGLAGAAVLGLELGLAFL